MEVNKKEYKTPNVFLYVANIMDYGRLITTMLAFYYAKSHPVLFVFFYFFSFALDAFDGMVARKLNQSSRYGATLDMVIDRLSTTGLLIVLSNFYEDYSLYFIFLVMLDIGSHWLQTNSGFMDGDKDDLLKANNNKNHKSLEEKFWILNFYYKTTIGLLSVCLGAEIFLLMLYYLKFDKFLINNAIFSSVLYLTFAIYALKQFISILQVISASQRIVKFDQKEHYDSYLKQKK